MNASALGELNDASRNILELARRARRNGSDDTLALAQSAAAIARVICSNERELEAETIAAHTAYERGELQLAENSFLRASKSGRAAGKWSAALRSDTGVAFIAHDRGDVRTAHDKLDEIVGTVERVFVAEDRDGLQVRSFVEGYRGNLARQGGDLDDARMHYMRALTYAEVGHSALARSVFAMDLGAAELAAGRYTDATGWLDSAIQRPSKESDVPPVSTYLQSLIEHYRALLLLGSPGAAKDPLASVEIAGPESLRRLREWLYDATRGGRDRATMTGALQKRLERLRTHEVQFEHARFGATILERLAHTHVLTDLVLIAVDGSSVVRRGATVSLEGREPLRRVLEALARRAAVRETLDIAQIISIGWPGEQLHRDAAKNRAHVALSTLRSLGLGVALVRIPGRGYCLDPGRVRIIERRTSDFVSRRQ